MSYLIKYDEDHILPLESEEYRTLALSDISEGELCLAYDTSQTDLFFEFDPVRDIDYFLDHARVVRKLHDHLGLATESTLRSLVLSNTTKATSSHHLAGDKIDHDGPLMGSLLEHARDSISASGDFKGMITCCECGIPGCGSQYAWIRNSACYVLFTVQRSGLDEVEFFPFRFNTTT